MRLILKGGGPEGEKRGGGGKKKGQPVTFSTGKRETEKEGESVDVWPKCGKIASGEERGRKKKEKKKNGRRRKEKRMAGDLQ